jgi:hypothetical protein
MFLGRTKQFSLSCLAPKPVSNQHPQYLLLLCIQVTGVRICYQAYEGGHAQSLSRLFFYFLPSAHPSQIWITIYLADQSPPQHCRAAIIRTIIIILLRAQAGNRDHTLASTSESMPVEHNRSGSALRYSSLSDVQQSQQHCDHNTGRPQRPTSVDHNRSLSLQEQPSQTQTIIDLLKENGLSVVPFFYVFSRDHLTWVTLSGPELLLDVVPPVAAQINSPRAAGQFLWEGNINVDFYDPRAPWRPYICPEPLAT